MSLPSSSAISASPREILHKHFDLALDAPDGIKKLRELILTLAIQGKLVPQDPKDQPASELLKEIEAEKRRLVKEGKIKERGGGRGPRGDAEGAKIRPEDVPYAVPAGWELVRLSSVFNIISGNSFDLSLEQEIGAVPYAKIGDINFPGNELIITTSSRFIDPTDKMMNRIIPTRSIIFPKRGGVIATNKKRIIDTPVFVDLNTITIIPMNGITTDFACCWLLNLDLSELNTGTSVPQINHKDIEPLLFPLPPFAEQNRIVAKIDQLMATCDALEQLRNSRQQMRRDIHTAAIHQILDPSSATPRLRVRDFLFSHFSELYSVKENVAELLKAILQLAAMGKLVPQDPKDQLASELLKEIEAEKRRLVKEGKIKERGGGSCGDTEGAEIRPEDVPYAVPVGWEWVCIKNVANIRLGKMRDKIKNKGVLKPYLRNTNVQWDTFKLSDTKQIKFEPSEFEESKLKSGDLLICEGGEPRRCAVWASDTTEMYFQKAIRRVRFYSSILPLFVATCIKSDCQLGALDSLFTRATIKRFPGEKLSKYYFPFPPLAEQKRIVAKIDQLMALCDSLEQGIDAGTKKQTQVLQSIIAGAI